MTQASRTLGDKGPHCKYRLIFALGVASLLVCSPSSYADTYGDVDRLVRAGQTAEALALAEQHLVANPHDPRMRLLKGVALAEAKRTAEAISVFTRLTDDYPELPESYNNLGALYAAQGQLDRSRSAFESAVQMSPKYAIAYENLGDIYARMASAAYAKASSLDADNQRIVPKLALARDLISDAGASASALSSAPAFGISVGRGAIVVSAKPAFPSASAPSSPLSPQSSSASIEAPTAKGSGDPSRIQKAIEDWAKAWSARDVSAYLAMYSADFQPSGQLTRDSWEEQRRVRILGKSRIQIKLTDTTISVNGNFATVKFRQDYSADGLVVVNTKTLEMQKTGDRWLITRESSGT